MTLHGSNRRGVSAKEAPIYQPTFPELSAPLPSGPRPSLPRGSSPRTVPSSRFSSPFPPSRLRFFYNAPIPGCSRRISPFLALALPCRANPVSCLAWPLSSPRFLPADLTTLTYTASPPRFPDPSDPLSPALPLRGPAGAHSRRATTRADRVMNGFSGN